MSHIVQRFLATSAIALALPFAAQAQPAPAAETPASQSSPKAPREPHRHGHRDHQRHHGGKHQDGMRALRGLDLSQAQRDQLRALFDAGREARRKQMEEMHAARQALHALALSADYNPTRAGELARDIAQKESALLLARAEEQHKLLQILTPAQRKQLDERKARKAQAPAR